MQYNIKNIVMNEVKHLRMNQILNSPWGVDMSLNELNSNKFSLVVAQD